VKPKKRREKPWRLISKELDHELRVSFMRGRVEVRTMYNCVYKQGPKGDWRSREDRRQERGPDLTHILQEMGISDKEDNILIMFEGVFSLIKRLVQRYEQRRQWKEYQEQEKRKKEWAERKTHSTRRKRIQSKQFGRVVEA
jgi:hypothetical protein